MENGFTSKLLLLSRTFHADGQVPICKNLNSNRINRSVDIFDECTFYMRDCREISGLTYKNICTSIAVRGVIR